MSASLRTAAAFVLTFAAWSASAQAPTTGEAAGFRLPVWSCPQKAATAAPKNAAERAQVEGELKAFRECHDAWVKANVQAQGRFRELVKTPEVQAMSKEQQQAWARDLYAQLETQTRNRDRQQQAIEKQAALYLETWAEPPTDKGMSAADFDADLARLEKDIAQKCGPVDVPQRLRTTAERQKAGETVLGQESDQVFLQRSIGRFEQCVVKARNEKSERQHFLSEGRWFWFNETQKQTYAAAYERLLRKRIAAENAEIARINTGMERLGLERRARVLTVHGW